MGGKNALSVPGDCPDLLRAPFLTGLRLRGRYLTALQSFPSEGDQRALQAGETDAVPILLKKACDPFLLLQKSIRFPPVHSPAHQRPDALFPTAFFFFRVLPSNGQRVRLAGESGSIRRRRAERRPGRLRRSESTSRLRATLRRSPISTL